MSTRVQGGPQSPYGISSGNPLVLGPFCLVVFAVPLVYLEGIYDYVLIPKLLVFHICIALGCVGWIARAPWGREVRLVSSPVTLPIICYFGFALVSAWGTSHPLDSVAELSYQASLVVLYFLSANLISFQSLRSVLWASGTAGLVVATIGILQYHSLAFLEIPTNAHPSATFGNRNLAAMYLVCAIPLSGYLFVTARERIALILSGLSTSLMGVYLVYTRTRSAWLGVAGAIFCVCTVVALWPDLRRPLLRAIRSVFDRRKVFLGLGFLVLFSVLAILPPRQARIQDRALPTLTQDKVDITATAASVLQMDVGMRMRFAAWEGTLRMVADHPFLGVGPGGWKRVFPLYDRGETTSVRTYMHTPHNDFLWIASEFGLVGLGFYVWILVAGFRGLLLMGRSPDTRVRIAALMFAVSLLSNVGDSVFNFPREWPHASMFPYLLLGIVASATGNRRIEIKQRGLGIFLMGILLLVSLATVELSRRRVGFFRHYLRTMSPSYYNEGDWPSVLAEVQKALAYGTFQPHVLYLKGNALKNLGRYEEAGEAYRENLGYSPNAWYAHDGLGYIALQQRRYSAALMHYQTALSFCPSAGYIQSFIGMIYLKLAKPDLAEEAFKSAVRVSPNDAETRLDLGKLHQVRGRLDSALVYFNEALSLEPNLSEVHSSLGYVHLRKGRFNEALAHYRKAVDRHPDDANAQLGLGLSLKAAGRLEEAGSAYRKSIVLRPDLVQAHLALGNLTYASGNFQEALTAYRAYLELSGGDTARFAIVRERIERCEEGIKRSGGRKTEVQKAGFD